MTDLISAWEDAFPIYVDGGIASSGPAKPNKKLVNKLGQVIADAIAEGGGGGGGDAALTIRVNALEAIDTEDRLEALESDADVFPAYRREMTERPGDAPELFYDAYTGTPDAASVTSLTPVTVANGKVLQVLGAHVLARRGIARIEPGRKYLVRAVVQRATDPADPVGDAVELGMAWFTNAGAPVAGTPTSALGIFTALTVASGRMERQAIVAAASTGDDVTNVAPATTVYARVFVQSYGADGLTNIEVLEIKDVTDAIGDAIAQSLVDDAIAAVANISTIEAAVEGLRDDAIAAAASAGTNLWGRPVDKIANTPDVSPTNGMRRLIGPSPTGAWSGNPNQATEYNGSAWLFSGAAKEGQAVYVIALDQKVRYSGSAFVTDQFSVIAVDNVAAMKAFPVAAMPVESLIYIKGRDDLWDGGEGQFRVTTVDPGDDDDGIIYHSDTAGFYFIRQFDGATINPLWYCGRTGDISVGIDKSLDYGLANGGAKIVVPPGTYDWDSQVTKTIPGTFAHDIIFEFWGARFNCPTSGYALEITKTGPNPEYALQKPMGFGGFFIGNATANGAIHLIDCNNSLWVSPQGESFSYVAGGGPSALMGCVIRQTTDQIQSELNSYWKPTSFNNAAAFVFDLTAAAVTAGKHSHLRTSISEMFATNGAGPSNGCFIYFGDGVDFGDCRISQSEGNFASDIMFYIGTGVNMTGTIFDGLNIEANSTSSHNKGIFCLTDHPSVSTTIRRPRVQNFSDRLLGKGAGQTIPIFVNASLAEISPEYQTLQPTSMYAAQIVGPLVKTSRGVPSNSKDQSGVYPVRESHAIITLTPGGPAVAIPAPYLQNGGLQNGAVTVRAWGSNGNACLVANCGKAATSTAATITNAISVNDTSGRSLTLSWTGTGGLLSIALSGTGSAVVYSISIDGMFT